MGQIIEITIVIGQPGNFVANFIAWKKRCRRSLRPNRFVIRAVRDGLYHVAKSHMWAKACGPMLMIRVARGHTRVIYGMQGQPGDAGHLSATTLPVANQMVGQR